MALAVMETGTDMGMAMDTGMVANMVEAIIWMKKEVFFQPLKDYFAGKINGNYK